MQMELCAVFILYVGSGCACLCGTTLCPRMKTDPSTSIKKCTYHRWGLAYNVECTNSSDPTRSSRALIACVKGITCGISKTLERLLNNPNTASTIAPLSITISNLVPPPVYLNDHKKTAIWSLCTMRIQLFYIVPMYLICINLSQSKYNISKGWLQMQNLKRNIPVRSYHLFVMLHYARS